MYYKIKATLEECDQKEALGGPEQFVAVLSPQEWHQEREGFDMGIELPVKTEEIMETRIEVNYDSLTGSFHIPDISCPGEKYHCFSFALDERGIIFIDSGKKAQEFVDLVKATRKWRKPSLERFLYDFLEYIIADDPKLLEGIDTKLNEYENEICAGTISQKTMILINENRSMLLDLRRHYLQLINLGQELEENENGFFHPENLRFFHMFTIRVESLNDSISYLRDLSAQLRELYQTQLSVKQNNAMTVMTLITTIFCPLSIITGWYGMNLIMPEVKWPYSYPVLIVFCIVLVAAEIIWFKKKKMM